MNPNASARIIFRGQDDPHSVGLSAGDAYDICARMLATYMGQCIPGNPTLMAYTA